MTMTMTDATQMLEKAGITPPKHEPVQSTAPQGVDPHTMPVDEIVFDPALLDRFDSLSGEGMNEASKYVFALYKSVGKSEANSNRNKVLHGRISTFITTTRRSRQTGGMVTEAVKTTKEQRDLAALLASQGFTDSDLAALMRLAKEQAGEES